MPSKSKEHADDNGMVIVDMNVEGAPWYNKERRNKITNAPTQQLTRSEARRYNFYAILAGLLVVFVFSATWILLTLFLTQVLFK